MSPRSKIAFGRKTGNLTATLDEWLMERYFACNSAGGRWRSFRVWNPPWPQSPARVSLRDICMLAQNRPWFNDATMIGAIIRPALTKCGWGGRIFVGR